METKYYNWNNQKNQILRTDRGVSFEEIVFHIMAGDLLAVLQHHNAQKYPGQKLFVVRIHNYVWLVPFVEKEQEIFLKTAIPSRKATRKYLFPEENTHET